jgi:hypothetical protein
MKILSIEEHRLTRVNFTDDDAVIYIADPDETVDGSALEKIKADCEDLPIVFCEFTDYVPNVAAHHKDEIPTDACSLEVVTELLEVLDLADFNCIYTTSTEDSGRAAGVALGLTAANHLKEKESCNAHDVLYDFVSDNPNVVPNEWVVGLFDYALDLNGSLITALEDYLATGEVINGRGRLATGTW